MRAAFDLWPTVSHYFFVTKQNTADSGELGNTWLLALHSRAWPLVGLPVYHQKMSTLVLNFLVIQMQLRDVTHPYQQL